MKRICVLVVSLALLTILIAGCGGSDGTEATPTTSSTNTVGDDADITVASQMAVFFYDMQSIQKYYDDGVTATAMVDVSAPTKSASLASPILISYLPQNPIQNVPPEFLKPLPPSGAIPAPAGACPAGAKPSVKFKTAGGDEVTPKLIEEKNLKIIPGEMVTLDQNASGSLFQAVSSMVTGFDMKLATSQGWDELLWDKLAALQTPAESLMDYQLWNAAPDLEEEIVNTYYERLKASGVPQMVLNAFNNSNKTGWFANSRATPQDALAQMNIVAEMSGSLNGTIYEKRDFSIPGAGQVPTFGPQTGEGTVTWEHPELGLMTFDVDILLDKFDAQGRAIAGYSVGVDAGKGYEIRFTFLADGSKKGELRKNGELIGLLNMRVDAEKFENYLDVQTNKSMTLPELKQQ